MKKTWYKGMTHAHTLNSDGDTSPGEVSHWFRDHGYDFVVISDHNYQTNLETLQKEFDSETERGRHDEPPFILIPGEEVSDQYIENNYRYVIHINGIGTRETVGIQGGSSVVDTIQRVVDKIHAAGGIPHLNHPNFCWSITADDILATKNIRHFEVYNGHPQTHNFGGGGHPGTEEIWDSVLSTGRMMYGIASDDGHHFQKWGPTHANPGRGWIVVRPRQARAEGIIEAIQTGDFYATTGVEIEDISTKYETLRLRLHLQGTPKKQWGMINAFKYKTTFIGEGGRVLKIDESMEPFYTLHSNDLYVRARVFSSGGTYAWTQPLFAKGKGKFA